MKTPHPGLSSFSMGAEMDPPKVNSYLTARIFIINFANYISDMDGMPSGKEVLLATLLGHFEEADMTG